MLLNDELLIWLNCIQLFPKEILKNQSTPIHNRSPGQAASEVNGMLICWSVQNPGCLVATFNDDPIRTKNPAPKMTPSPTLQHPTNPFKIHSSPPQNHPNSHHKTTENAEPGAQLDPKLAENRSGARRKEAASGAQVRVALPSPSAGSGAQAILRIGSSWSSWCPSRYKFHPGCEIRDRILVSGRCRLLLRRAGRQRERIGWPWRRGGSRRLPCRCPRRSDLGPWSNRASRWAGMESSGIRLRWRGIS